MNEQSQVKYVLRWVAFVPVAAFAAWLAWLLVMIGNRLTFGMQGLDPQAFVSRIFIEFISSAAMGTAFVYVGARVAPSHHREVAYALSGFGLVAAGFMLFPAFRVANYWAVWSSVSLIFGVGATAYNVSTGEVELKPQG